MCEHSQIHFWPFDFIFGLYIRFVNLMEGQIWLESDGLGKGCTAIFMVKLGIPGCSNEAKLPLVSRGGGPGHVQLAFPGLKVLLMDENG